MSTDDDAAETLVSEACSAVLKPETYSRLTTLLNQFIVAYSRSTGTVFGGTRLRKLTEYELSAFSTLHFIVQTDSGYRFTGEDLDEPFSGGPLLVHERPDSLTGEQHDLDLDENRIRLAVAEQHRHLYLETHFDAAAHQFRGEFSAALLLAVSSLESAHAALVRITLEPKLRELGYTDAQARRAIEDLLREQGISTLMSISPALMMPAADRPNAEEIRRVQNAIQMRNAIAHAAVSSEGTPKVRGYTAAQMIDALENVDRVFERYARAVAAAEDSSAAAE
jgi:hypothetical protein